MSAKKEKDVESIEERQARLNREGIVRRGRINQIKEQLAASRARTDYYRETEQETSTIVQEAVTDRLLDELTTLTLAEAAS